MADFKFFNIGKANAEILRLEAELSKAQEAEKIAIQNASEVSTVAESLKEQFGQVQADLVTAKATIASVTARAEKTEAELKVAQESLANPAAQIVKIASTQAAQITAAQGQPPLAVTPQTSASGGNDLTAELATISDPAKRQEFIRKHKAALFERAK